VRKIHHDLPRKYQPRWIGFIRPRLAARDHKEAVRDMDTGQESVNACLWRMSWAAQAEPDVVVAIARRIVVAIRRAHVVGGIIEVAATFNAVRASMLLCRS